MPHCWEVRGCDAEMQSRCPHNIPGEPCPSECNFSACDRPTHEVALGFALLDNPDVDRAVACKEVCRACTFFISHGPKVGSDASQALAAEIEAYEAAGGFRAKFGDGNLGLDAHAMVDAALKTEEAARAQAQGAFPAKGE